MSRIDNANSTQFYGMITRDEKLATKIEGWEAFKEFFIKILNYLPGVSIEEKETKLREIYHKIHGETVTAECSGTTSYKEIDDISKALGQLLELMGKDNDNNFELNFREGHHEGIKLLITIGRKQLPDILLENNNLNQSIIPYLKKHTSIEDCEHSGYGPLNNRVIDTHDNFFLFNYNTKGLFDEFINGNKKTNQTGECRINEDSLVLSQLGYFPATESAWNGAPLEAIIDACLKEEDIIYSLDKRLLEYKKIREHAEAHEIINLELGNVISELQEYAALLQGDNKKYYDNAIGKLNTNLLFCKVGTWMQVISQIPEENSPLISQINDPSNCISKITDLKNYVQKQSLSECTKNDQVRYLSELIDHINLMEVIKQTLSDYSGKEDFMTEGTIKDLKTKSEAIILCDHKINIKNQILQLLEKREVISKLMGGGNAVHLEIDALLRSEKLFTPDVLMRLSSLKARANKLPDGESKLSCLKYIKTEADRLKKLLPNQYYGDT